MQEPVLTLFITTPQSWAERHAIKRRRIPRSPKRHVVKIPRRHSHPKMQDIQKALVETRSPVKKSPTNSLQLDPFQTFPIPTTPCVSSMAQYFLQVWAAQHGRAFALEGHPNPYLSLLWPFALQSDIYFEALIALCRATYVAISGQCARGDRAFVWHHGNVMTKLRARLSSPQQCADDNTILTVATLGTIDYILGDHTAATAHVSGMRQMIKIRGGIKLTSPWERLLSANVNAYEALWSFLFAADSLADESRYSGQILQNAELPVYMAHPFKPEVCEMLSKLPPGFCDLGLTGVFSLQMIRLLSDVTGLRAILSTNLPDARAHSSSSRQIQTTLEDLHRLATLQTTPTERFLAHGLVAYCYLLRVIYFGDPLTGFYETAMKALADIALHQTPTHRGPDRKCYLWVNMMIAIVLENGERRPSAWKSVMQHFFDQYHEARQWKALEKELRVFFWEDRLCDLAKEAHGEALRRKDRPPTPEKPSHHSTMAIRNVIL